MQCHKTRLNQMISLMTALSLRTFVLITSHFYIIITGLILELSMNVSTNMAFSFLCFRSVDCDVNPKDLAQHQSVGPKTEH